MSDIKYCNAISKRTQQPCRAYAVTGREKCYHHGGKSLRGLASPTLRHGRYAKDLPTRLLGKYREALEDQNLLALRDEIALIESRVRDLIQRVDTGESSHLWKSLQKTWQDLSAARQHGDGQAMAEALNEMGQLIARGMADYAAWEDVGRQLDRKQRLVDSERRRLVEMQQMMTVEQAMLFMGALLDAIHQTITDRDLLSALEVKFRRILPPLRDGVSAAASSE
jgi:hypothetical protein